MSADAVLEIMKEAADTFVRPRFRALSADQVQEKAPGDLVTVADREAEVAIAASLRLSYPGALIVGEEACAGNQRALAGLADAEHAFTKGTRHGTRRVAAGDGGVLGVSERGDRESTRLNASHGRNPSAVIASIQK